jgi:hypothetical protein
VLTRKRAKLVVERPTYKLRSLISGDLMPVGAAR